MKILIKRTYLRENCTVGFLQVILSGAYESEYLDATVLKPHPLGGAWTTLCDTLEPHAIPWEDNPLIGQHRGERIPGKTAEQSRGDILIGRATRTEPFNLKDSRPSFNLLFNLISEAIGHGEAVTLEVRSHKAWTTVVDTNDALRYCLSY